MRTTTILALTTALLATAACSPPSADDLVLEVIQRRNQYDVTLSSWVVREEGPAPFLYLDVMFVNNNQESMRTLTVMVEQLDADDNSLGNTRVPVDVSALTAGIGQSIGVEVRPAHPQVEGVRLFVESNPPREVWPEFPEFDAVRPRI